MTGPEQTGARFATTNWSMIVSARGDRAGLEALLRRYWSPVYAYLRRHGHGSADAADLTQGFLSEVLVGRNLAERADPSRGRFRAYMLQALSNFVVDQQRRGTTARPGASLLPANRAVLAAAEPRPADEPPDAFHRQWATTVLATALERVEASCRDDGLDEHWRAFEGRVLHPIRDGAAPVSLAAIIGSADAAERDAVSKMIHTVKRKLRRAVHEVVAETTDEGEVDEELADLLRRW